MENDRLNFRAWVPVSYYDKNGDDCDAVLLIENVTVYSGGDIGCSEEQMTTAVSNLGLSEHDEDSVWDYIETNYSTESDLWYQCDIGKIEQSTGMIADGGRLIYEGDIIQNTDLRLYEYEVFWREYGWYVRRVGDPNNITSLYTFAPDNLEIMGNIHEPKYVKKTKKFNKG